MSRITSLNSVLPSSAPKRRPRGRLLAAVMEVLERRRLLSATAQITSGILTVTADTSTDTILVQPDGLGNDQVLLNGSVIGTFGTMFFNGISITNAGGNDSMTVASSIATAATITGGAGAEIIAGGGGYDSLIGGAGPDSITGGTGNDTINGGGGDDTLVGGTGNDRYVFSGSSSLGSDYLQEDPVVPGPDSTSDTLDFSAISSGTGLLVALANNQAFDIGSTAAQAAIASQLTLQLSSDSGIENVVGTPYGDNIQGNARPNLILGQDGLDMIWGGDGNDTLNGEWGNQDCVHGEGGNDLEYGGPGNQDDCGMSSGADDPGNDTLYGGAGTGDSCFGGSGADLIYGDDGSVAPVPYAGGDDVLSGGSESDTIYGGGGNDNIDGGSENDLIFGDYATADNGYGGYSGSDGNDTITGGGGDDLIYGDTSAGSSYGVTQGNDSLAGGTGNDLLVGDDGISGAPGGNDTLDGGDGNDTLTGQAGSDLYVFQVVQTGTLGTDSITEAAADGGTDTLDFSQVTPPSGVPGITVDISSTSTQVVTSGQLSLVIGSATGIENVSGSAFSDAITGNSLSNSLLGGDGSDTLHGGDGNDTLNGGRGQDQLFGENGNDTFVANDGEVDTLYGGAGNDTATLRDKTSPVIDSIPLNDIETL